jgi:hypothetical protein
LTDKTASQNQLIPKGGCLILFCIPLADYYPHYINRLINAAGIDEFSPSSQKHCWLLISANIT